MHYNETGSMQCKNALNSCSLNIKASSCNEQTRNIKNCNYCKQNNDINHGRNSWGLVKHPLASVYAPLQEFDDIHDCETALLRGTIFNELDLPFHGSSVVRGGCTRD